LDSPLAKTKPSRSRRDCVIGRARRLGVNNKSEGKNQFAEIHNGAEKFVFLFSPRRIQFLPNFFPTRKYTNTRHNFPEIIAMPILYIVAIIIIVIIWCFAGRAINTPEYSNTNLTCALGKVNVQNARWSSGTCSGDVTSVLKNLCDGSSNCAISAGVTALGDPCPGKDKILTGSYNCSKFL
jgi:Galactose binding lectin domain